MTARQFTAKLRDVIKNEIRNEQELTQPHERMSLRVGAFREFLETLNYMEEYYSKEIDE